MTEDEWWQEVRDCAVAIAAGRMRRNVLTVEQIADALDEAYRQGLRAAGPCDCNDTECGYR